MLKITIFIEFYRDFFRIKKAKNFFIQNYIKLKKKP
jgi:hypothetical protein